MMNQWKGMLGAGLVAIALSIFAIPSKAVFASECVQPESCSSLAAKAAANFGATDPADYIKTWTFVNCDAQGYFRGAMLNYQNCQATKAAEDKKAQTRADLKAKEEKAKADAEKKKNEEAKKAGKPYTSTLEYGKDVKPGDTLKAGRKETIMIRYPDGTIAILEPGSSMKIKSDDLVDLILGKFKFVVMKVKSTIEKKFEVPYRGVPFTLAVRGTKFEVEVKRTSFVLKVVEGFVDVSNPKVEKALGVGAGYSVVGRKNGSISKPKAFEAEKLGKEFDAKLEGSK